MKTQTFRMASYVPDGEAFTSPAPPSPSRPRSIHTHDFYECFWIEQGEGLHWINSRKPRWRPASSSSCGRRTRTAWGRGPVPA